MTAPRTLARRVAAAAVLATAALSAAATPADEPRDLSSDLDAIRRAHDLPGMAAVTVLADGRIEARGAAGVRRRGGKEAVTIDDRFHLGSCTKAMTATLCALLVAEKKLAWDDRPAAAFAKAAPAIDAGWKDATLEMLLCNRGGAPASLEKGGLWARLWAHPGPPRAARLALVSGMLAAPPAAAPGTKFEYSNAGFATAGAMAERAADAAWEDLLRARVLGPLGMTSAGFGAPCLRGRTDQPCGHRADGTVVPPGPGDDNPDAIGPAGKVHASLPDWAKFVALHVAGGKGAPEAFAKVDFAKLHAPAAEDGRPGEYAMGWLVTERPWAKGPEKGDRGRVLTHAGSNTSWFCVAWLAPERGFAVLVATNQGGDGAAKACDDAAARLIQARLAGTK